MTRYTILLALLVAATVSFAQRTIPLNLEQLVKNAGSIVDATVVKTETGKDATSGLLVTWITLHVNENFYGAENEQYTFKQYGGEADGIAHYPAHMPRFTIGERTILFLNAPSKIGMQSPVGLQQGKFIVAAAGTGKFKVLNVTKNPSLYKGISSRKGMEKSISSYNAEDGSLEYGEFAQLIRSFVQQIKQ
ncbi:MAG: hypothetical protein WCW35_10005 [Bacteroidota bacterium]